MSEYVRVCAQSELPQPGRVSEFSVAGRPLCIANAGGEICVLDGVCPHEGGPLGEGTLEQGKVVCPWHAYAYDVHTGQTADDPDLKAQVFAAKVENGEFLVSL